MQKDNTVTDPGYVEILAILVKTTRELVLKTSPLVAGETTLRAAIWSLAGRACIAAKSAAVLSVIDHAWCDMQAVGRTVFECALSIKLLQHEPEVMTERFWEYCSAQHYEHLRGVLDALDRGEHVLPDEGAARLFRAQMDELRASHNACKNRKGWLRARWFGTRTYASAAKDVALEDQYRWWFKSASVFVHATPLSAARFLDEEWRDGALRHASYFISRALALTAAPAVATAFDLPETTVIQAVGLVVASVAEWPGYAVREGHEVGLDPLLRGDLGSA